MDKMTCSSKGRRETLVIEGISGTSTNCWFCASNKKPLLSKFLQTICCQNFQKNLCNNCWPTIPKLLAPAHHVTAGLETLVWTTKLMFKYDIKIIEKGYQDLSKGCSRGSRSTKRDHQDMKLLRSLKMYITLFLLNSQWWIWQGRICTKVSIPHNNSQSNSLPKYFYWKLKTSGSISAEM